MDIWLNGTSKKVMSIVGVVVDYKNPSRTLKIDGKEHNVYAIKGLKLAYYPSLEILDVTIDEFIEFYKSIDLAKDRSYKHSLLVLNNWNIDLSDIEILEYRNKKTHKYEYFTCSNKAKGGVILLPALVFDIETGRNTGKTPDKFMASFFLPYVAIGYDQETDAMSFRSSYSIFRLFNKSFTCEASLDAFDISNGLMEKDKHSTIRVPYVSGDEVSVKLGIFECFSGIHIARIDSDLDSLLTLSDCRVLFVIGSKGIHIKNLVLNKGIEYIKMIPSISNISNVYYSNKMANIKVLTDLISSLVKRDKEHKITREGIENIECALDEFKVTRDLEKLKSVDLESNGVTLDDIVHIHKY